MFAGQYFDEETGLHYNYFRYYDPQTGRYTQSDPIGLIAGPNTYGYAHQNPLIYLDPLGLDTLTLSTNVQIPSFINDWFGRVDGLSGVHSGIAIEFPGFFGGEWDFAGFFGADFMQNVGLGKATLNLGYDMGSICDLAKESLEVQALFGVGEFGASFDPNEREIQGFHVGLGLAPGNIAKFFKSLFKGNKIAKAYANNMISIGGSANATVGSLKRGQVK